jgi:hypothetical protein
MDRRQFTALGMSSLIPWLGATQRPTKGQPKIKRFICLANPFGMHKESFWPTKFGTDFEITKTLEPLRNLRGDFSLFSKMTHGLKGGHVAQLGTLTTILPAQATGYKSGMQSLDQKMAEYTGNHTRFPSLVLGVQKPAGYRCSLSWTRTGTLMPTVYSPQKLFNQLFVQPNNEAKNKIKYKIDESSSLLDGLTAEMKLMKKDLSSYDHGKVEEYLQSIREVEKKVTKRESWLNKDVPKVSIKPVEDSSEQEDIINNILDLTVLALETDQTRVATVDLNVGYHGLSHHGKQHDKVEKLVQVELMQMRALSRVISKLKVTDDPLNKGDKMLDNTVVLFASGLGSGNSHSNENLPIIMAGGGFQHGRHVNEDIRLGHLFVSILDNMGISGGFKDYQKPFYGY